MNDCAYWYYQWTGASETYILADWHGNAYHYACPNPQTLIENEGQIEMDDIRIHWNVIESDISVNVTAGNPLTSSIAFEFPDDGDHGFVNNFGVMDIHNLTMDDSVGRIMFFNEGLFIFRKTLHILKI